MRSFRLPFIGIILLGLCAPLAVANETYYVRPDGSDAANGLTPGTAFRTVMKAVTMCTGRNHTVYVGPGTYDEEIHVGTGAGSAARSGSNGNPNRIIGDVTGGATGLPAGPVTINGGGVRGYGIRIQNRNYWEFSYLTFSGQTYYGMYTYRTNDTIMTECTIDVPRYYAIYGYQANDIEISENLLRRTRTSGHCMMLYNGARAQIVESNRLSMYGTEYLSSGFRNGSTAWGGGGAVSYPYGILIYSNVGSARIEVRNNVGSDLYLGVYVYSYGNGSRMNVANNSFAGCLYGIYAYAYSGTINLADNIVASSYYGAYLYERPSAVVDLRGLLTYDTVASPLYVYGGASATDHVNGADPLWIDPAAGNFGLQQGSPAIDAGTGFITVSADILGNVRPYDGDNNGVSDPDFGAYEFAGSTQPLIVSWQEAEPD